MLDVLQFHPEFNADITRTYAHHHREDVKRQGIEIDNIIQSSHDTPHGGRLLKRFRNIVEAFSKR
jgi:hypothetical protein